MSTRELELSLENVTLALKVEALETKVSLYEDIFVKIGDVLALGVSHPTAALQAVEKLTELVEVFRRDTEGGAA